MAKKEDNENLKIIDFEIKGSMVKFYLGKSDLKMWWGDDWNDTPYEHNAEQVYNKFVSSTKILAFDFDDLVLEPSSSEFNSPWCKDDMVLRKVPCVIVVPASIWKNSWNTDFKFWNRKLKGITKFYMGDHLQ